MTVPNPEASLKLTKGSGKSSLLFWKDVLGNRLIGNACFI